MQSFMVKQRHLRRMAAAAGALAGVPVRRVEARTRAERRLDGALMGRRSKKDTKCPSNLQFGLDLDVNF